MPRAARTRAGRPSAAASAATRARILRAARRAFAARGYARARNREIAEAAGVTSPALYHWFASKADLFAAVHAECLAILLGAYREAAAAPVGCAGRLAAIVRANARLDRAHPGLAAFLALAPVEIARSPELARRVGDAGAEIPALLRAVLEEGVRAGELPADLDLPAAEAMLVAASFGMAWMRDQVGGPARHEAMLEAFARLLEAGLDSLPTCRPD